MSTLEKPVARQLFVRKAKTAPLLKRYHRGSFESVGREVEKDGQTVKRVATVGLDNSHSSDYKVGAASDSLMLITATACDDHNSIKRRLNKLGVETSNLIPIHVPHTGEHGEMEWKAGFKSLPRDARKVPRIIETIKGKIDSEHNYFESQHGIEAFF